MADDLLTKYGMQMQHQPNMVNDHFSHGEVYFTNPQILHPFVMEGERWERMGRPEYIRVEVYPTHENGLPIHD